MHEVKVLGPGCRRCEATAALVLAEAARLGVAVRVEKVTDPAAIARWGIAATPGVVLDGAVVHAGGLPSAEAVARWLAP